MRCARPPPNKLSLDLPVAVESKAMLPDQLRHSTVHRGFPHLDFVHRFVYDLPPLNDTKAHNLLLYSVDLYPNPPVRKSLPNPEKWVHENKGQGESNQAAAEMDKRDENVGKHMALALNLPVERPKGKGKASRASHEKILDHYNVEFWREVGRYPTCPCRDVLFENRKPVLFHLRLTLIHADDVLSCQRFSGALFKRKILQMISPVFSVQDRLASFLNSCAISSRTNRATSPLSFAYL